MLRSRRELSPAHKTQEQSRHTSAWLLFVLAMLLGLSSAVQGQVTSGTIYGSVQDSTGAAVQKATLTASDTTKGVTRTTSSSASGSFALPNLPPGT